MRNNLNIEIGKRIRYLREVSGYSREQLAEQIEISSRFLADIELGTKGMSFQTLIRFSEVLHTTTDYLLLGRGGTPEETSVYHLISEIGKDFYPEVHSNLLTMYNTIQKAKKEP